MSKWTQKQTDLVVKLYPSTRTKDLATQLNKTLRQVYAKAYALGLKKTDEYLAGPDASRMQPGDDSGVRSRFKPGHTPWNKGTKGVTGVHPNTRKTQFKKGEMTGAAQHNYKPIGSLRITKDGYLERKVTDDHPTPARRWVAVHRLLWEAENGAVPRGHIITFKPGMKTTNIDDVTLDRLELITRSENMQRNTVHRYPKEISNAIQLRGALNRRINNVQKHK